MQHESNRAVGGALAATVISLRLIAATTAWMQEVGRSRMPEPKVPPTHSLRELCHD
jgi:hypothetical protein